MSNNDRAIIISPEPQAPPGPLAGFNNVPAHLLPHLERFLAAASAANTHRARKADWEVFGAWCHNNGFQALPASVDTVVCFILDLAAGETVAARKPATLARYLSTISTVHQGAGHESPTDNARVRVVVAGLRRDLGTRQRLAAPVTSAVLEQVRPYCDEREWALLCFGQATACRRSELCALDIDDVRLDDRGAAVFIAKSKTDQERRGRTIGVRRAPGPLCPVAALEAWLKRRRGKHGPLFLTLKRNRRNGTSRLSPHDLNRAVKRVIAAAGLPVEDYSAHSLRAGYVTDARRAGKPWIEIMEHTGHTELKTAKGYARYDRDPFAIDREE